MSSKALESSQQKSTVNGWAHNRSGWARLCATGGHKKAPASVSVIDCTRSTRTDTSGSRAG